MKKSSRNLYSSSESLQYVAALVAAAGPRILELYRGSGSAALALRVFTPPGGLNNVGLNGVHSLPSIYGAPQLRILIDFLLFVCLSESLSQAPVTVSATRTRAGRSLGSSV